MARLQEQAAQSARPNGVPADRLEKCAVHLRDTVLSINRATQPPADPATVTMTQKIKLMNFLRQQK
ncbi:hypothetical protein [Asticcacaulis solisilvae]|uniref:hypothetical protein n=1 Tax=Asticcacaulis solisilvae TaxID=1217274 RepID=UPI003FD825D6